MTVLHSPRLAHFQRALHHLTCVVGRAVSWCALLMVFLMVLVVVMRYGFGIGNIALRLEYCGGIGRCETAQVLTRMRRPGLAASPCSSSQK